MILMLEEVLGMVVLKMTKLMMAVGEVEEVSSFGCIVAACGCDGGGICQVGGGEDNVDNDNDGESDVWRDSVDFDFDFINT